jgi:hypothetical protein
VLLLALLAGPGTGHHPGDLARYAAAAWLLAHDVPLRIGSDPVTLVPLLLTLLVLWRLGRAGVHVTRTLGGPRSVAPRAVLVAAGAVALAYALLGAVAAVFVGPVGVEASPLRAGLTTGALAGGAAAVGAFVRSRPARARLRRLPMPLRDAARTGGAAFLLLVGAGAAVVGAALAVRSADAAAILGSYHAGLAGQAGITLVCLAYLPNLALWGSAYLLGPGFMMGTGSVVSPGLVAVGPVPALPVLAALPHTATSGLGSLLLALPLVAAMAAGVLLARRRRTVGWLRLLTTGLCAGPVAGGLMGLAQAGAGGALGADRLAVLGTVGWSVALWATLLVSSGAVVGAAVTRAVGRPPA